MPGKSIFLESYGVTVQDIESYLSAALERGGDYADLFFELRINHSIAAGRTHRQDCDESGESRSWSSGSVGREDRICIFRESGSREHSESCANRCIYRLFFSRRAARSDSLRRRITNTIFTPCPVLLPIWRSQKRLRFWSGRCGRPCL